MPQHTRAHKHQININKNKETDYLEGQRRFFVLRVPGSMGLKESLRSQKIENNPVSERTHPLHPVEPFHNLWSPPPGGRALSLWAPQRLLCVAFCSEVLCRDRGSLPASALAGHGFWVHTLLSCPRRSRLHMLQLHGFLLCGLVRGC